MNLNHQTGRLSILLATAVIFMLSIAMASCSENKPPEQKVEYITEGYRGIIVSNSRANVRSAPSKSASIVASLDHGAELMVCVDNAPGATWLRIEAPNNVSGYVASRLIAYNTNEPVLRPVVTTVSPVGSQPAPTPAHHPTPSRSNQKYYRPAGIPPYLGITASCYYSLVNMSHTAAWLILLGAILVEFGIVFWLKNYYTTYYRPSTAWMWVILGISTLLTIPTVLLFWHIGESPWEYTVYLLMLLSTACLMLHAAWRVKQYGMDKGIAVNSHYHYYEWGIWIANILWIMVLLPILGIWWDIIWDADTSFWMFENNFWTVIGGCVAAMVIPAAILYLGMILIGVVFHIANQTIYYIMCTALAAGLWILFMRFVWNHYSGFSLVFPMFACIVSTFIGAFEALETELVKSRCPNCHNISVKIAGKEFLGSYSTTSTHWQDASSSGISASHTGGVISDVRKQYRTVSHYSAWETQMLCPKCRQEWSVREDECTGSSTRATGRQTYKETWLN